MNWRRWRRRRRAGQAAAGPESEPRSRLSGARRVTPPIHAALQPCPRGAAQAAAMATAPSLSARSQLINACEARRSQARPARPPGPRAPAAAARLKFRAIWGKEGGQRRKEKEAGGGGEVGGKKRSREREKKEIFLLPKEAECDLEVAKAKDFALFCFCNRGVQGGAGAREGRMGRR